MFNEMSVDDQIREPYRALVDWMEASGPEVLEQKRLEAETLFRKIGITFAVYGEGGDPERLIPFDIIPRIIEAKEWDLISRGLRQRVRALNAFIAAEVQTFALESARAGGDETETAAQRIAS